VADGRREPRRSAPGQSRSEEIRLAALGLFAERGYLATSMEDIGQAAGIRGPSVYRHYPSKQQMLYEIMRDTMDTLIAEQQLAVSTMTDLVARLRRMVEAHVRYHARHRLEAFVGNREIKNLDDEKRAQVLAQRHTYESGLRKVIEAGVADGSFQVGSSRLASYAILDMGMGISAWYSPHGELTESQVVYEYGEFALSLVRAGRPREAALGESAPGESAPGESAPGESAPGAPESNINAS
jgi:AcrR family transcriptional regulator